MTIAKCDLLEIWWKYSERTNESLCDISFLSFFFGVSSIIIIIIIF